MLQPYVSFPVDSSLGQSIIEDAVQSNLESDMTLSQLVINSTDYEPGLHNGDDFCSAYNFTLNMFGLLAEETDVSEIEDNISSIILGDFQDRLCSEAPDEHLVDIVPVKFPVYFDNKIVRFIDGVKYSSVLTIRGSRLWLGCFVKIANNTEWALDGLGELGFEVPDQNFNGTFLNRLEMRTLSFALVGTYSSIIGSSERAFVSTMIDQLAAEMKLSACYFVQNVTSTNRALTITQMDPIITSYCGALLADLDVAVAKFRKRLMTREWHITDVSGFPNRILAMESVRGLVLLGKYDDSQFSTYAIIISVSVLVTSVVYLEFMMFLKRRKKRSRAQFVKVAPACDDGDLPGR